MSNLLDIVAVLAALARLAEIGMLTLTQAHQVVEALGMTAEQHAALDAEYVRRILVREREAAGLPLV
jgi:hypothetical protein